MADRLEVARKRWEDAFYTYGPEHPTTKAAERALVAVSEDRGVRMEAESQYSSLADRLWPDNFWNVLGVSGPGKKGDEYRTDEGRAQYRARYGDNIGAEGLKRSMLRADGSRMVPNPAAPSRAPWASSDYRLEGPRQSMPVAAQGNTTTGGRGSKGKPKGPSQDINGNTNVAVNEEADRIARQEEAARRRMLEESWAAYGITNVRDIVRDARKQGFGADSDYVTERIFNSEQYRSMYGNVQEAQKKAGLPVMTFDQIATQRDAYRDTLRRAGLPKGFYDDVTDFDNFLTNGVSPGEVASRVNLAQQVVGESVMPETMQSFRKWYGISKGDIVAYFLDPDKAEPLLQKQAQAAILGGEAMNADLGIGRKYAENLVEKGIDQGQARQAFQESAADLPALGSLAAMEGTKLGQRDVIDANLDLSPKAAQKVKKLASRERARFGGSADASRAFGAQDNTF